MILEVSLNEYKEPIAVASLLTVSLQIQKLVFRMDLISWKFCVKFTVAGKKRGWYDVYIMLKTIIYNKIYNLNI